jgi:CheY-like chemotaxis protein
LEELIAEIANCADSILIVDDQEDVLRMLSALLDNLGYKVLLAEDGQDAVEKYTQHCETIGLVLMDIVMPRKTGIHAYIEIKEMNPAAKIILMSGYDAGHLSELSGLNLPHLELVLKPFSPINLLETITKHLPPKQLQ